MSCKTDKKIKDFDYQLIDSKNKNLNLSLSKLQSHLKSNLKEEVYSYVIASIVYVDNTFYQAGCGPNFEGGIITLCTCKHYMRAYKEPRDWKDKWICGLVNLNNKTYLQYLMQVENAVNNMYDLCELLPPKVVKVKSASLNVFGDVYTPKKSLNNDKDKYNVSNYNIPIGGHKHEKDYKDDIYYKYQNLNRCSSFLVGDPENSFIWTEAKVEVRHPKEKKFTQGCKHWNPNDFIKQLK